MKPTPTGRRTDQIKSDFKNCGNCVSPHEWQQEFFLRLKKIAMNRISNPSFSSSKIRELNAERNGSALPLSKSNTY